MLELLALVLPLGLDTFAVAAALGVAGLPEHRRLRVVLLFCAFEAGMPLVGLGLGAPLGNAIGSAADYVAIGLLIALGLFILIGPEGDEQERVTRLAGARGTGLMALGLLVSLDELAIGFSIGLLGLPTIPVLAAIAAQAFVAAQLGLRFGTRLGERVREGAERLAGVVLGALGLVLLGERLLGG